jgi:two-component system sensor histidine kinase RegB
VVVACFVVQMAQAVRNRDETLARVRGNPAQRADRGARHSRRGAAHELGTPLSTMAVVIGELQHEAAAQPGWRDGLAILEEQVRGCKRILDKILANAQDRGAATLRPADHLATEVLDEWQLLRPAAQYQYHCNGMPPAPLISVDASLRAALMNLLNNAADAPASDAPQAIETARIGMPPASRWRSGPARG